MYDDNMYGDKAREKDICFGLSDRLPTFDLIFADSNFFMIITPNNALRRIFRDICCNLSSQMTSVQLLTKCIKYSYVVTKSVKR